MTMPKIARIASLVAFVMAGFTILSFLTAGVYSLLFAPIPLLSGIGIVRRRAWSAYGFALYAFAELLMLPFVLLRSGGSMVALKAIVGGLALAALASLFLFAGRSLDTPGTVRGLAWPWIVVAAATTVPLLFVQAFVMPSASMEDTILIGDRMLVRSFPKPNPAPGDMIVFRYPIDRRQVFVKRVIGAPGDRLRISDRIVYRNGVALKELYAVHKSAYEDFYRDNFPSEPNGPYRARMQELLAKHVVNGELIIPEGNYFVLGDSRDDSLDSRYWGFVRSGDLIGEPFLIYDSEDRPYSGLVEGVPTWPRQIRWGRFFKSL
jgi:signal peptidase I